MSILLEIACFSERGARLAAVSGADRIEFCQDYPSGGVTPELQATEALLEDYDIPVFVMVRPRPGEFVFSTEEVDRICADIIAFREIGVQGIVAGALTSNGKLDEVACKRMREAAGTLPFTFHRAFDTLSDPRESLEQLISWGFQRILTSGGAGNAIDNLDTLQEYVLQANDRIIILPGGGVRPDNLAPIIGTTGAKEVHSSALHQPDPFNSFCDPAMIRLMKEQLSATA